ncbi:MAG: hypothetical protein ACO4AY_12980 [Ilumatobacteraceae bacterium]
MSDDTEYDDERVPSEERRSGRRTGNGRGPDHDLADVTAATTSPRATNPLDALSSIPRALRGYDPDQTYILVEQLVAELAEQRARFQKLASSPFANRELRSLNESEMMALVGSEGARIVKIAQERAEAIMKEAEGQANQIRRAIDNQYSKASSTSASLVEQGEQRAKELVTGAEADAERIRSEAAQRLSEASDRAQQLVSEAESTAAMIKSATEADTERTRDNLQRDMAQAVRDATALREQSEAKASQIEDRARTEASRLRNEAQAEAIRIREETLAEVSRLREEAQFETKRLRDEAQRELESAAQEAAQLRDRTQAAIEDHRRSAAEDAARLRQEAAAETAQAAEFAKVLRAQAQADADDIRRTAEARRDELIATSRQTLRSERDEFLADFAQLKADLDDRYTRMQQRFAKRREEMLNQLAHQREITKEYVVAIDALRSQVFTAFQDVASSAEITVNRLSVPHQQGLELLASVDELLAVEGGSVARSNERSTPVSEPVSLDDTGSISVADAADDSTLPDDDDDETSVIDDTPVESLRPDDRRQRLSRRRRS